MSDLLCTPVRCKSCKQKLIGSCLGLSEHSEAESVIRNWCAGLSALPRDVLFVEKLRKTLTPEQIAAVIKCLGTTCPICWDADLPCSCSR